MISDPQSGLPAEALVAMTGIFPSRGPSELEARGADNYLARIRRRIVRFLESRKVESLKWQRPPSQKDLWQRLSQPFDEAELDEWFDGWAGHPAVPIEYPAIVQQARDHVKSVWPIFQDNSLGLHTYELAPDEYGDVWHICRTLNDPETLFDDLDSMVLLPVQVEAVAKVYPGLYEEIRKITMLLLEPYVGIEGGIEQKNTLPGEREEQIRTLLQVPNDGPIAAAPDEQQQNQAKASQEIPDREELTDVNQTPSEHVAQRRLTR